MPAQIIPLDFSGGVNLLRDQRRILPNQVIKAKNLFPSRAGMLSTRGVAQYADLVRRWADGTPTNFIFSPYNIDYAYTYLEDDTHYFAAGAGTTQYDEESWTNGLNDYRPCIIPYNQRVYCLPGVTTGVITGQNIVAHTAFQSAGQTFIGPIIWSQSQVVDRAPRVAGIYRERMVLANFGEGFENALIMCDPRVPFQVPQDFLSDNGSYLRIGAEGDRIVAVVEITQTAVGTPAQSALLVLCEFSAHIITGETLVSTDTPTIVSGYLGDAQLQRVSYDCGCSSAETVVRTPFGIFWAGHDDVWMFTTGSLPVRIGKNIRPTLAHTHPDKRYLWHAAYFDGVYRLAVASDGQGPANFDAMGDQWWLDLRDGPPRSDDEARWWGPQQYKIASEYDADPTQGTYFMAVDLRIGREPQLFAIHKGVYDTAAFPIESIVLAKLDVSGAYDSALNTWNTDFSATLTDFSREQGNELDFELVTPELDFGDPMVDKLLLGAEVNLWNSEVLELDVEFLLDGGRDADTQQIQVDQKGLIAGVDGLDTRLSREFQSILVHPDADNRMRGKTVQLRLYSTPGWPVVADGINHQVIGFVGPSGDHQALALAPGFYEDVAEFCDHLASVLSELGATITHNADAVPRDVITFADEMAALESWGISFADTGSSTVYGLEPGRNTRKVFASLGFDTSLSEISGFPDTTHQSVEKVRTKLASQVEIGGIFLRVYTFGSRPKR